mgnify:FL=1|jgi:hypothetical protein
MGELIIMGFGDSKKIDLTAKTTEEVMSQIKSDVREMAAAKKEKEAKK